MDQFSFTLDQIQGWTLQQGEGPELYLFRVVCCLGYCCFYLPVCLFLYLCLNPGDYVFRFRISWVSILSVLQVRSALLAEVDEARRSWEVERCRLQQEVQEQRGAKRNAEEALALAQQACQARVAELRSAHHQHQEELNRTKRDCEREIRRLVWVITHTNWLSDTVCRTWPKTMPSTVHRHQWLLLCFYQCQLITETALFTMFFFFFLWISIF